MSLVLVDSSVWIEYLRGGRKLFRPMLEELIDTNRVCVNDLILTEILPPLLHKKEKDLVNLFRTLRTIPLHIDWQGLIRIQEINIKTGLTVALPDCIILQNAVQHNIHLFTLDKHFSLMKQIHPIKLYENENRK